MLTSKDIKIGQIIKASFFFRRGMYGDDIDYTIIIGKVIRKLECYNQILVDVNAKESFNPSHTSVWVKLDKADVNIIN